MGIGNRSKSLAALLILTLASASPTLAAEVRVADDGRVVVDGNAFGSWSEYVTSEYFRQNGLRCGTPDWETRQQLFGADGMGPGDCSDTSTNPSIDYEPDLVYVIPVVVHIIMNTGGTGNLSDAMVESQIAILNEDFRTVPTSNGANGTNLRIHFVLAGITRTMNDAWFNDGPDGGGWYYDALAWDPNEYMNIYTNTAGGFLGYVPFLPSNGGGALVGQSSDRVVILYSAFGRDSAAVPYDQGRTATHEIGHYLGLDHTFSPGGVCGSDVPPGCYLDGDLICDTNPQTTPNFGCPAAPMSCSSLDPFTNYMDYTDDTCMMEFTPEQTRRVRCTLAHYRDNLENGMDVDFHDHERGDTLLWDGAAGNTN